MNIESGNELPGSGAAVLVIDAVDEPENALFRLFDSHRLAGALCCVIRTRLGPDPFRRSTGFPAEAIYDGAPIRAHAIYLVSPEQCFRLGKGRFYLGDADNADGQTNQRRLAEGHDASAVEQGLRRYSRELEEANRDLETFSYSISHDLRAPLRAVDGFSRILLEDHGEALNDEARQLLGGIHGNAMKMARLIDDLLEFSRMGRQAIEPAPVDMHRLALEAVHECTRESGQGALIDVDELPGAEGDRTMLRLVLLNLIGNALKYSAKREQPRVRIGAERCGASITYFVQDNGVGFDMQRADRLFGVFQRLHEQREFQGTGLGLAIVSRVITRHGGRIWAQSEEGRGATFYFTLPAPV